MRYVVIESVTGSNHPYMPNKRLFKYKDLRTGLLSFGAWTSIERAKEIVDRKNKEALKFFAVRKKEK